MPIGTSFKPQTILSPSTVHFISALCARSELAQFMPVETLVQAQLLKDTDRGPQVYAYTYIASAEASHFFIVWCCDDIRELKNCVSLADILVDCSPNGLQVVSLVGKLN